MFDIIVFGGTGYTGEHVIREMFITAEKEEKSWAIAGRSLTKMNVLLERIAMELCTDKVSDVGVIVADIDDLHSINNMCSQGKLLINCVGPYYKWGRQVVDACVTNKTHYLDISGEPLFMEHIEADYEDRAKEAGIYVVSACGFDSIPADMGVRFCQENFPGTLTAVESYMNLKVGDNGFAIHLPTFQCIVNGFATRNALTKFRKDRKLPHLTRFGPVLKQQGGLFKNRNLNKFCVPFAGADHSVVLRSQRRLQQNNNITPVQCGMYLTFQSTGLLIYLCLFGIIFIILVSTSFGRKLLLKHPKLCTLGLVSKEGATPQQIDQASFSFVFYGHGYSTDKSDMTGAPDRFIEVTVVGPDPGYVSCSRFITQAAYVILNKNIISGGVVTPGVALHNSDYVERLRSRGIEFNVVSVGPDRTFHPLPTRN